MLFKYLHIIFDVTYRQNFFDLFASAGSKEYFIEKLWRDIRPMTIADGENSVLNRLGGQLLKDTFPRTSVNLIA